MSTCPICQEAIRPDDDVFSLGCRGRRERSSPHQIHCTPCGHEWLRNSVYLPGPVGAVLQQSVQCPVCRDARHALNSMRPGGTYAPLGCLLVLTRPVDMLVVMPPDANRAQE